MSETDSEPTDPSLHSDVATALASPATTIAEQVDLLDRLAARACAVHDTHLANRLLDLLLPYLERNLDDESQRRIHACAWQVHAHDPSKHALLIRHAEQALACCAPDSDEALRWHARAVMQCLSDLDPDRAQRHMQHLEPRAEQAAQLGLEPVRLRNHFDLMVGRAGEVADRLARGPQPGLSEQVRLRMLCMAHLFCHDHEQCEVRFHELLRLDGPGVVPNDRLRLWLLIGQHRYDEAEERLRRQGVPRELGVLDDNSLQAVLQLALSQRRRSEARDLLRTMDPAVTRRELSMEWTRLHLLEDDFPAAVRSFTPLVPRGRLTTLDLQLFWSHEISLMVLGRLWHACATTRPGQAQTTAPTPTSTSVVAADDGPRLIGSSAPLVALRQTIASLASADQPVLVTGETGTGKEIVARLLHRRSPQAREPFVALNAAGLPEALAEAELFGHAKGAFTGAIGAGDGLVRSAGRGVLFIDEVNSMPLRIQGLLLRLLESGEYRPVGSTTVQRAHCRFVFASNRPLESAVADGSFRQDVLYRINRLTVDLPPLRARPGDIPELCAHFLAQIAPEETPSIEPDLLALFRAYDWPGNVRELRNEVERLVLLRTGRRSLGRADAEVLSAPLRGLLSPANRPAPQLPAIATAPVQRPMPPVLDTSPADVAIDPRIPGAPTARRRRRQIIDLCARIPRLYREDVIREVGCSPDTATSDLQVLVSVGLLRRVLTSGHLRTSYFVRADAAAE